jgi:ankyrin repeat protein
MGTACFIGNQAIVRALLDAGVVPQASDIETAAGGGHADIVRELLASGVQEGMNAWLSAAEYGHAHVVRALLDARPDADWKSDCLRRTAVEGHFEIVRMLLDAGADPNSRNGEALRGAARFGHLAIVKALLEAGADSDAENKNKDTALIEAAGGRSRQSSHAAYLRASYHLDRDLSNWGGTNPLKDFDDSLRASERAAQGGQYEEIVTALLTAGANVDAKNLKGETPLSVATHWKESKIVALLGRRWGIFHRPRRRRPSRH